MPNPVSDLFLIFLSRVLTVGVAEAYCFRLLVLIASSAITEIYYVIALVSFSFVAYDLFLSGT